MEAVHRITNLKLPGDPLGWSDEDFVAAAREAIRRWRDARKQLGVQFSLSSDALEVIDPEFHLQEVDVNAIKAALTEHSWLRRRVGLAFVKWSRSPATCGFPNPYEPLIQIWEHGGSFNMEHGLFMDVYGTGSGAICYLPLFTDEDLRKQRSPKKPNRRQRRLGDTA